MGSACKPMQPAARGWQPPACFEAADKAARLQMLISTIEMQKALKCMRGLALSPLPPNPRLSVSLSLSLSLSLALNIMLMKAPPASDRAPPSGPWRRPSRPLQLCNSL